MRPIIIIFFLLCCKQFTFAQLDFGTMGHFGYGNIYNDLIAKRNIESYFTKYKINWTAGLFGKCVLSEKSSIELDLLFNRINSVWSYHMYDTVNGEKILKSANDDSRKFNYISFPLTYQLTIINLQINIGVQYSLLTRNIASNHYYDQLYGIDVHRTLTFQDMLKGDFSFVTFVAFPILDNLLIELRFNQGLINTTDHDAGYEYHTHSRQFLLGLKYEIFKNK